MPLGINFRRPQIFSLDIVGPKVVLLCKFSLYRVVRAPVSLTSLMDDPALQICIVWIGHWCYRLSDIGRDKN